MRNAPTLLIAAIASALMISGCQKEQPATEEPVRAVRAMKIADFAGVSQRSFPGRAAATQEIDLAFRVAGPLIARPVNVGDNVKEGDLIARIDPRDFEVALRNAEGSLQRSRANEQRAQADYDRVLSIQREDPGAVSQAAVDRAKEALDVAKADIAALEASVDAAKDALADTDLEAPFAGTIVAAYVENFQNVREKQMIARLLDKTRIEFTIDIPESLISMISYVQDIRVRFDAFRDFEVPAEVKEIGNEASETTRTFPVTLIMDQPAGATILPGMAGRATGVAKPPGEDQPLNIVIPVTAVFAPEVEDKSFVWRIDESKGTVSRREVQVGKLISGGYVVNAGLEPGEMIATAGVHFLKEGQQVRPEIE
ncbi:MAG: efflux RND transporter periplasmic adaptor subunit [Planctomycetota bacterium]|nr:efflux RND transporter periplasmic adaptor subunit [Planctomycetota bacterium]